MSGVFDMFDSRKRKFKKEMKEERRKKGLADKNQQRQTIHRSLESLLFLSNREAPNPRDVNRMYEGEYEVIEWRPTVYVEREVHPGGEVKWLYNTNENSQDRMVDLIDRGLVALIDCTEMDFDRKAKEDGRDIRIRVKSYSGVPIRRLDGDRMGRKLPGE